MDKTEWIKIIDHQVDLVLKEHSMTRLDLSANEICKRRFEMALKLLEELG